MKVEEYIADLRMATNRLALTYGAEAFLDTLTYGENENGVMQRAEIRDILALISQLNTLVEALHEDCGELSFPPPQRPIPGEGRGESA